MRPAVARLDLAALRHNAALARQRAPLSRLMAVVKADAYGHGAATVARTLADIADGFAVACLEEGMALREAGITAPVLLLEGVFRPGELIAAQAHGFAVAFTQCEEIDWLEDARLPGQLNCWLKLDTGMHRLGIGPDLARKSLQRLLDCGNAAPEIVACTHFARADEPDCAMTDEQLNRFLSATAGLALQRSAANSPAVLAWPETHLDWIRPGYMLYGNSPFTGNHASAEGLIPVMQLESAVIAVREIPAGDSVGYGALWTAARPSRIATVAIGYADGYPRTAANGTPVLICGQRAPLVGRVSMDMLTVDVTDLPPVNIGDPVRLWGIDVPVGEIAGYAGTTGYDLLAGMPSRVARRPCDKGPGCP